MGKEEQIYKKVLMISRSSWVNEQNSGSTYSSIFNNWPKDNIAHIFTQNKMPSNSICDKYFRITDRAVAKSIFKKNIYAGEKLELIEEKNTIKKQTKFIIWLKKIFPNVLKLFQELMWSLSKVNYRSMQEWINEFSPEILHISGTNSLYIYRIAKKIISSHELSYVIYISDDIYTMCQFNLSPFYWLHKFFLRFIVRKFVKNAKTVFVISEMQKKEYDKIFKKETVILRKSFKEDEKKFYYQKKERIKMIYMGNLKSGRWKILLRLAEVIEAYKNEIYFEIYSNLDIDAEIKKKFSVFKNTVIENTVSSNLVLETLEKGDVLVHVESFDLSKRLATRLSFSAKIVDYLEAKRCILVIGHKSNASINFFKKEDGAIIINTIRKKMLFKKIEEIINNKNIVCEYAKKSSELGEKYFSLGMTEKTYLDKI